MEVKRHSEARVARGRGCCFDFCLGTCPFWDKFLTSTKSEAAPPIMFLLTVIINAIKWTLLIIVACGNGVFFAMLMCVACGNECITAMLLTSTESEAVKQGDGGCASDYISRQVMPKP